MYTVAMERDIPIDKKPFPYEPIDGLFDAFAHYKLSAILDGSITPEDLVYTGYALAGQPGINGNRDLGLLRLAYDEVEALRRESARG
jgi:hypothetical protein